MKTPVKVSPESLSTELIAPCGMNCGLCRAHVRAKASCPGCRADDALKPRYCVTCKIKTCDEIASGARAFCIGCAGFPCDRLRQLDRRYRTKYGMSMVDNLAQIQTVGIDAFVAAEKRRWTCQGCGGLLSVHRPECGYCGRVWKHDGTGESPKPAAAPPR